MASASGTRTLECAVCGERFDPADPYRLVDAVRRHYLGAHRDVPVTDERIRRWIRLAKRHA